MNEIIIYFKKYYIFMFCFLLKLADGWGVGEKGVFILLVSLFRLRPACAVYGSSQARV